MDIRFIGAKKREALYNEVWSEPVITVAKRYGMSDNGLRKHCKKLGIPLPFAGYWARLKAGEKIPMTPLPKVTGEFRNNVRNYFIKYKPDIENLTDAELTVDKEFSLFTEETINHIKEKCSQLRVKSQLRNPHRLITEHKEEFFYRKKKDKALKQASFFPGYYARVSSEYRQNKPVLPIKVSESNLNRTYRIMDTLIHTLEEMEGETRVGSDPRKDEAYFSILHSDFYFEVKEDMRKKLSSTNNAESNSGLVLSISIKEWFPNNEHFKKDYKDKNDELLEAQVGKIIYDMFVFANKRRVFNILSSRGQKRACEEQERQRRLEQIRESELKELKMLEQTTADWRKAELIRSFTDCLEAKIKGVDDVEKRDKLWKWLKWARDKADWLDPLTAKEDTILGRSKHVFELIEQAKF